MIDQSFHRICGLHVEDDGSAGVVWVALDKISDVATVYDCCVFKREVLAVISEGLNARGRWVPIAWNTGSETLTEKLLERGCNLLPDGHKEDQASMEMLSREIQERMRTSRFKVDKRLSEWLDEFKLFSKEDGKIPDDGFPLMSATRHALEFIKFGRRQSSARSGKLNYPKLAII